MSEEQKTFADYGVRQDICDALAAQGITTPFPIQALTLPVALDGHDIIGQAKTGTGKTLGFGLPAIQRVVGRNDEGFEKLPSPGAPQALIIVPTRELAVQVGSDLSIAAKERNARIVTLYGGVPYEPQTKQLDAGAEVIVGTPGRLIDLHRSKKLNLTQVKMVILDEADEMLDLGFLPDVEKLLSYLPERRQTLLFSATMPGAVLTMARRYMNKPMHIRAESTEEHQTKASIRQVIYRAHPLDKDELVGRILRANGRGKTIIFTKTKRSAAKLTDELKDRGFAAGALHGDLNQVAREKALAAFREGSIDVLVATDVAARGIDVDDVTHVINFQCPEDEKTYLHRVGRTGRAENEGTAVTLVDWEDVPRWSLINKELELGVPEPVETYSSSDHLFADLDIPEGTKGRVPRTEQAKEGTRSSGRSSRGGRDEKRDGERRAGSRSGGRGGDSRRRTNRSEQDGERPARTRTRRRRVEGEETSATARGEKTQQGEKTEKPQRRRTRSAETPQQGEAPRRRRRRRTASESSES